MNRGSDMAAAIRAGRGCSSCRRNPEVEEEPEFSWSAWARMASGIAALTGIAWLLTRPTMSMTDKL